MSAALESTGAATGLRAAAAVPRGAPTTASRLLVALALGVPTALLALVATPLAPLAALLAVALVLPVFVRARAPTTPAVDIAAGIACAVGATVLALALVPRQPWGGLSVQIQPTWAALGLAALATAAARSWSRSPRGGVSATLALGLVAMMACGATHGGSPYVVGIGAFALLAVAAGHASDPGRPGWRALGTRHRVATVGVALTTAATALGFSEILPPAHVWVLERAVELLANSPVTAVGFSERLTLGALRHLLQSRTTVLRVRGGGPMHLRGAVYDQYTSGSWRSSAFQTRTPLAPPPVAGTGERPVSVSVVDDAVDRYFLPLEARALDLDGAAARPDAMGVVHPARDATVGTARFALGERDAHAPAPPGPRDRQVPSALRALLERRGRAWTAGADTDAARVRALVAALQANYTYSLERDGPAVRGVDPVADFLEREPRGHCEYFAAALALLARSIGVPARVVGGYRADEPDPLGDGLVVRERDAHAWVEAWVEPGEWRTFDATPAAALEPLDEGRAGLVRAWLERARERLGALWLAARGGDPAALAALFGPPVLALVVTAVVRRWRARGRRARARGGDAQEYARPLAAWLRLEAWLGDAGARRTPSETLERFAERLQALEGGLARDDAAHAAALVRRYAALRYGHAGDDRSLGDDVSAFLARRRGPGR